MLIDGTVSVFEFTKGTIVERSQYAMKEDQMFKLVLNMNEKFSLNSTHAQHPSMGAAKTAISYAVYHP